MTSKSGMMPAGCASASCVTTLASGLDAPSGIALDNGGNVYVISENDGAVTKIPRATPTPSSLSFTATDVGATSTDSPQTMAIQNIGNAPLTLPTPPTGFAIDAANTTCADPLDVGSAACTLALDFTPVTGQSGNVSTNYTLDAATLPIPLSGVVTALAAPLPVAPVPLDARAMLMLLSALLAVGGAGAASRMGCSQACRMMGQCAALCTLRAARRPRR